MKALTIKDIILEKIEATGADGLCYEECIERNGGCGKDDLFKCNQYKEYWGNCVLAKSVLAKEHCAPDDCINCYITTCSKTFCR